MLAEVLLIAGKDLRIERRSKVALNQVAPFAILIVVLFGSVSYTHLTLPTNREV